MNFSMFVGFIVGNLVGLLTVAVAIVSRRRKGYVDADERAALINARSGEAAFRGVSIFTYCGWVTDNVLAYLRNEPPRFFSLWSAMVAACILSYLLTLAYFHIRMSADGSDEALGDRARKPTTVALLLALGSNGYLLTLIQVPELQVVMIAAEVLLLISLIWTFAPAFSRKGHPGAP